MSIESKIQSVRHHIPANVQLICVSKFNPIDSIIQVYNTGERNFGESKVQELCLKFDSLPKDINWHFIGHLQTNKIKNIVPFVSMIHGVDSFRQLSEIDKQASKSGRRVNCLLQVHIASEETKFGFSGNELFEMLSGNDWKQLKQIQVCGLMGMATFTDNLEQIRREFCALKTIFDNAKSTFFETDPSFKELSMGMSDDFKIAIEEGSTMVRIGSSIFGQRNYT